MSYLASRTRYVVSSVLWCFTHVIIKYAILIGNPCSATVLEFLAWFILQLVVFKVTSRGSYHSRLSVTKARAAPSCDFYPWEWCSSISCGKTPLYPAYTLPKALMTSLDILQHILPYSHCLTYASVPSILFTIKGPFFHFSKLWEVSMAFQVPSMAQL